MRISEPKRIARAATARSKQTPVLAQIDATDDESAYTFKFRCYPSATGRTHNGHIMFYRPRNPNTKLEKLECSIDCECPDFRYRWAWANKQRGSSRVGPQSLNQAWNRAPRITNPGARPGLCKHLLALKNYIYGKTVHFAGKLRDEEGMIEPSGEEQLQNLVQQVNQRAKWRLAQQKHRADAAAEQAKTQSLTPGLSSAAAVTPGATATTTVAGSEPRPPAVGVPAMPKKDFIKTVRPALQKQVATRFIRPESTSAVVRCMKSLLEETKAIHNLLHEVDGDEGSFDPNTMEPAADDAALPPPEEGAVAPEELEAGGSEVVNLLRDILTAVEALGAADEEIAAEDEEVPEEEPIIPPDAEEIEGEGDEVEGDDDDEEDDEEGGDVEDDKEFDKE